MIKAVIAVATFGVAAAMAAPAVAQTHDVKPVVVAGGDPISDLLGGLLGGGGGGAVGGLLGGSGSPVEQLTGTLGGVTGGLGGVTGGLGGVTGALPGVSTGKRMMAAQPVGMNTLLDTLQASLGSVPADLNGSVSSLGGVVEDLTGTTASLTGATEALASTVENVVGNAEGTVAEVARVTEFGNLVTGAPGLNLGTLAPLTGKVAGAGLVPAITPTVDAVSTEQLASTSKGAATLVKSVTDTATNLVGGLAPALTPAN
ncbi:hypothetical protein Aple_099040 [Acrocarpospora pleiomorpha]|uniref:Uncharacterized protein n=2 Tax=Acrocarpospora pleiomorpha TaxID=90975 RepID=A0A5M3Y101_9ACTN|nr:hypothetical protein Aple_099040 [Acrocarpospora pleiomorpha]